MARLILDSGALIALGKGEARARAFLQRAAVARDLVVVPAVVVAEVTRGSPRDAPVNRVLKAVDEIAPVTEERARAAGRLLAVTKMSATIDALVVAEAIFGGPAVVLTGDIEDLSRLAGGLSHVRVHAV